MTLGLSIRYEMLSCPPIRHGIKRKLDCVEYCSTRAVCKLTGKIRWTAPSL